MRLAAAVRSVMWAFTLVFVCYALTGCGFRPVYGSWEGDANATSANGALNDVWISTIADRHGQILRNMLTDKFHAQGRPDHPRYRLDIQLSSGEGDLGLRKDATATGRQLTIYATCVLTDTQSNRVVARWNDRSIVRHNVLLAPYATQMSRDDAWQRGLMDLSESVTRSVAIYLQPEEQKGASELKNKP